MNHISFLKKKIIIIIIAEKTLTLGSSQNQIKHKRNFFNSSAHSSPFWNGTTGGFRKWNVFHSSLRTCNQRCNTSETFGACMRLLWPGNTTAHSCGSRSRTAATRQARDPGYPVRICPPFLPQPWEHKQKHTKGLTLPHDAGSFTKRIESMQDGDDLYIYIHIHTHTHAHIYVHILYIVVSKVFYTSTPIVHICTHYGQKSLSLKSNLHMD